jgi:hypothetical protein
MKEPAKQKYPIGTVFQNKEFGTQYRIKLFNKDVNAYTFEYINEERPDTYMNETHIEQLIRLDRWKKL